MLVILEPTEQEGQHRVVIQHQRDDLNLDEVVVLIRAALIAYGFHPDSVAELLPEEQWTHM